MATFGRGFYILDNYTPIRELAPGDLKKECLLFSVKDALMFIPKRARYGQGETYFKAKNPELGATFTWYLKEAPKTLKQKRKAEEKEIIKKGKSIKYPTFKELRAEDTEHAPYLLFSVSDEAGQVVRRLKARAKPGIHRLTWDLRYPSTSPTELPKKPFENKSRNMLVMPGKYSVKISQLVNGVLTSLAGPQTFKVEPLSNTTLPAKDRKALVAFQTKVAELGRAVRGTVKTAENLSERIKYIKEALHHTPGSSETLMMMKQAETIEKQVREILRVLTGDKSISKRNANQPPSISSRINRLLYGHRRSSSEPTQTMRDQYRITGEKFEPILTKFRKLVEEDLKKLEADMEKAKAPWTPGRIPQWKE